MPFLCHENAPQKCKWQQYVRLVINKRRSPTGDAAAPHRPPRASRSDADQAHIQPQTNRPLNRLLSLCKITIVTNTFARRKARRGAEPSPLIRSGATAAFPRRVPRSIASLFSPSDLPSYILMSINTNIYLYFLTL